MNRPLVRLFKISKLLLAACLYRPVGSSIFKIMASDGLLNYAKTGKCHICHRVRKTTTQVKAVGEVRHGYATGHIWECIDTEQCDKVAFERISAGHPKAEIIKISLKHGRIKEYGWRS